MLIDAQDIYSDAQAITAASASTDSKDHGVADAKVGDGTNMSLLVQVITAFVAGTATYLQIQLQDSDDDSTFNTVLESNQIAVADLIAGKRIVLPLPPGLKRYTRVYFNTDGTFTAGVVDAFLIKDVPSS